LTSSRAKLFLVLTNVASIACLIWVLRDAELHILGEEIGRMRWPWVAVAAAADIFVYFLQGWRWSILLAPVSEIPIMRSVRAIYVGLFANEVLPFRSGEIIRCYLQSRWGNLPISVTLSSALIERIFDGIWLVVYLAIVIQFVDVPKAVQNGGYVLMVVITALAAVLGYVMFYKQQAKDAVSNSRWARHLHVLVEDLHAIGNSRSFYFSWLASLPHLLSMTIPIWAVARAYGLEGIGLLEAAVVNVVVRLGTVIPAAPGNLGAYQALVVVALTLLGIDAAQAKRFSLVLWGIVTLPLLIAGFIALSITGFKIGELQREAQKSSSR
jgi:uncharacterized protein (TIRG00374 family)